MELTRQNQDTLITSFSQILLRANTVTEIFYDRLFEAAPEVRDLFPEEMIHQRRKIIEILQIAVQSVYHLELLTPRLRELGKSHINYGVKPEYYPIAHEAWLLTLEEALGEDCTPQVKEAWSNFILYVADIMTAA